MRSENRGTAFPRRCTGKGGGREVLIGLIVRAQSSWITFRARFEDETGAVATEYALLLTLIALAIVVAATALGLAIAGKLQSGADCINTLPNC